MTDGAPAMPMPPRIRDERRPQPMFDDRRIWSDRRAYWRMKQEQADALLDAIPFLRQREERIALCDVTYGCNGGVWL